MGYTTYEFYRNTYHGDIIAESSFAKWNDRAADVLDQITFGRLKGHIWVESEAVEVIVDTAPKTTYTVVSDFDADTTMRIQKAACAVADKLCEIDTAGRSANSQDAGNVKSRSSGNESISYGQTETVITKAVADPKFRKMLLYCEAADYLSGTGLLYAGVE